MASADGHLLTGDLGFQPLPSRPSDDVPAAATYGGVDGPRVPAPPPAARGDIAVMGGNSYGSLEVHRVYGEACWCLCSTGHVLGAYDNQLDPPMRTTMRRIAAPTASIRNNSHCIYM